MKCEPNKKKKKRKYSRQINTKITPCGFKLNYPRKALIDGIFFSKKQHLNSDTYTCNVYTCMRIHVS